MIMVTKNTSLGMSKKQAPLCSIGPIPREVCVRLQLYGSVLSLLSADAAAAVPVPGVANGPSSMFAASGE